MKRETLREETENILAEFDVGQSTIQAILTSIKERIPKKRKLYPTQPTIYNHADKGWNDCVSEMEKTLLGDRIK